MQQHQCDIMKSAIRRPINKGIIVDTYIHGLGSITDIIHSSSHLTICSNAPSQTGLLSHHTCIAGIQEYEPPQRLRIVANGIGVSKFVIGIKHEGF